MAEEAEFTDEVGRLTLVGMPVEVQQNIIRFLPNDKDVANFGRLCRITGLAVTDFMWYRRFCASFDPSDKGKQTSRGLIPSLALEYKSRQYNLNGRLMQLGDTTLSTKKTKLYLKMLETLVRVIRESDAHYEIGTDGAKFLVARNHQYLRQLIAGNHRRGVKTTGTDLLDCLFRVLTPLTQQPDAEESLIVSDEILDIRNQAVVLQLTLTHIILDKDLCMSKPRYFSMSQRNAYASALEQPICIIDIDDEYDELNTMWFLHVVAFFKYHLKYDGILTEQFSELSDEDRPRPWLGKLSANTKPMAGRWKGVSTFLSREDLLRLRQDTALDWYPHDGTHIGALYDDTLIDRHQGYDPVFEDLLFFDINKTHAPHVSENWSRSLQDMIIDMSIMAPNPTAYSKQARYKPILANGFDGETSYIYVGTTLTLSAQEKIPGFQIISMARVPTDTAGMLLEEGIWHFEGCVLSGGNIIIGRWFSNSFFETDPPDEYSGPFLFWRAEDLDYERVVRNRLDKIVNAYHMAWNAV